MKSNSKSSIEEYLLKVIKKALSKNSYRSWAKMNSKIDPSRISKTLKWLSFGRIDKCEKYATVLLHELLGYTVEKKITYVVRNSNGKKVKEINYEPTRVQDGTEKEVS